VRTRYAVLIVALLAAAPAQALAQAASAPAQKDVFIRSTDGIEVRAQLLDLGPSTLSLFVDGARRDIPFSSVERIQTRGDSVWNGAAIGAAIGAGLWGMAAANHGGEFVPVMVGAAIGYGLIGAGVDAMIPGRTTIYAKPPSDRTRARDTRAGLAVKFGF
jgi:hypothetical protein